jgi:hypothetical protein
MERKYYVYVWYRKTDDKPFYVGKGQSNRYTFLHNRNNFFMNMYNKHGGYAKKVRENLTEIEAFQLEKALIKEYKKKFKMTNITDGGEGVSGLNHSKKTRETLSKLSKIQWSDPEMRKRLCESRKKTHNDPEFRKRASAIRKGKILTDERKENIRKYGDMLITSPDGNEYVVANTSEAVDWFKEKGYEKTHITSVIKCLTGDRKSLYKHKIKILKVKEGKYK